MTARTLIRIFPREWRERYGDEFAALLDARPITARETVNTIGFAARLWLGTGAAVLPIAVVIAEGALLLGRALRAMSPPPEGTLALVLPCFVTYFVYFVWRGLKHLPGLVSTGQWGDVAPLTDRTVRYALMLVFAAGTVEAWVRDGGSSGILNEFAIHLPAFLNSPYFVAALVIQGWSTSAAARRRRSIERLHERVARAGRTAGGLGLTR
jgi:hypothetical protein